MKRVICKHGETRPGETTLTPVVKHVPARVCDNCGETCVYEATTGCVS